MSEFTVLTIETRKPEKWLAVDTETGQVWKWDVEQSTWVTSNALRILPQGIRESIMQWPEGHPCRSCGLLYKEHPTDNCEAWY